MTAQSITQFSVHVGLFVLAISFLLTVWRVIRGPTLPDRVIALDMLVGIVMGFIALIAIRTGFTLYIDIAISLGLVGFLATVAFARFILSRKLRGGEDGSPPAPAPTPVAQAVSKRADAGRSRKEMRAQALPPGAVPGGATASGGPIAADPGGAETSAKPIARKSDATKASAAKVKIAKAKAAGKAAVVAEAALEGAAKDRKARAAAIPARPSKKERP